MIKLYKKYLDKKGEDKDKLYLFKVGNFYIFLGDDAMLMSDVLTLNLTNFSKESKKCGFPLDSFVRYTKILEQLGYEYEVVLNSMDYIVDDLKRIDSITEKEAWEKIMYYKSLILDE